MKYCNYIIILTFLLSCNSNEITKRYADGSKQEERIYLNKNKGDFKIVGYYQNGKIKSKRNIIDTLSTGKEIYYYSSGAIKEIDSLVSSCKLDTTMNCDRFVNLFDERGIIRKTFALKMDMKMEYQKSLTR